MLTVRHIKTKTVPVLDDEKKPVVRGGVTVTQVVPELDINGDEIVLWTIEVPRATEAAGSDAIVAYVAAATASADTAQEELSS